jgi:hypothetical protein
LLLAAAIATPALGYLLAGQVLGAISGSAGVVFALLGVAALYVLIVTMIARGLRLILGAIGALFASLAVFVMVNFPSAGASVQGPMLPTFWHVLNRFWIGASASDAFRGIVYFGGQGVGTDVLKLLGWLAVGAVLLALVALRKLWHERQRHQVAPVERSAAQPAVQQLMVTAGPIQARDADGAGREMGSTWRPVLDSRAPMRPGPGGSF